MRLLILLAAVLLVPAAAAQAEPDEPRGIFVTVVGAAAGATGGVVLGGVIGGTVGFHTGGVLLGGDEMGDVAVGVVVGLPVGSVMGGIVGGYLGAGEPVPRGLAGATVGALSLAAVGTGLYRVGVPEVAEWIIALAPVGAIVGAVVATR